MKLKATAVVFALLFILLMPIKAFAQTIGEMGTMQFCILNDFDDSGTLSEGDQFLEGRNIVWRKTNQDPPQYVVFTTENDGCVSITLPVGTEEICQQVAEGWRATADVCMPVEVEEGESSSSIFFLTRSTIGGIDILVFDDADGNGVQSTPDEKPIANVETTLYKLSVTNNVTTSVELSTTTSASDGYAVFRNLTEGFYKVCETVPQGWNPTTSTCHTIEVDGGNIAKPRLFGNKREEPTPEDPSLQPPLPVYLYMPTVETG